MRFISPTFHGILDYAMSIILIISPFTMDYYEAGPESMVPIVGGLLSLFITPFTDFKPSIIRIIPMKWHLWLDFFGGIFLTLSPWIFDFYRHVYAPHVMFGILLIVASVTTKYSEQENLAPYKKLV